MIAVALVAAAISIAPGASESFETLKALPTDWTVLVVKTGASEVTVLSLTHI